MLHKSNFGLVKGFICKVDSDLPVWDGASIALLLAFHHVLFPICSYAMPVPHQENIIQRFKYLSKLQDSCLDIIPRVRAPGNIQSVATIIESSQGEMRQCSFIKLEKPEILSLPLQADGIHFLSLQTSRLWRKLIDEQEFQRTTY